jgi:hypothetical protein
MTMHDAKTAEKAMKMMVALSKVVEETVIEAGPDGAPSGPVYAALMTVGVTLPVYESIVDALIGLGKIRRSNHVLYAVTKGGPK